MSKKLYISVTEFKAKCLEILREVNEDHISYSITKHKKVVAEVHPPQAQDQGSQLRNSILFEGDLISSVDDEWEVDS